MNRYDEWLMVGEPGQEPEMTLEEKVTIASRLGRAAYDKDNAVRLPSCDDDLMDEVFGSHHYAEDPDWTTIFAAWYEGWDDEADKAAWAAISEPPC